jgi:ribosomal protein S4
MRHAQQLILHGKIVVNNALVHTKSYVLNPGDIISVPVIDFKLIQINIIRSLK